MKKKHGNISRHRHVYKNNCVFTAIPFYIQEMTVCFPITKQKEPIIIRFISCDYRLCVNASGSVITEIFNFFTLIRFSCLHFGQYSGKFFISVSSRILNRVLLLHTGHKIHFSFCNAPPLIRLLSMEIRNRVLENHLFPQNSNCFLATLIYAPIT